MTSGRVAVFFGVRYASPLLVLLAIAVSGADTDRSRVPAVLSAMMASALLTHAVAMKSRNLLGSAVFAGMAFDATALGILMLLTGGVAGPIPFIFTVQAVAAGVLLSSRAGVRMLTLSSLAIIAADVASRGAAAQDSGLLPSGIIALASLWVIGGGATLFSTYNERELRRQNAELATIRQISLDIEDSLSLPRVLKDLCRGVMGGLRFDAAAVLVREGDVMRCVAGEGMTGSTETAIEVRGRMIAALDAQAPTVTSGDEARRDGSLLPLFGSRGYLAVPIAEDFLFVLTRAGRRGRPGRLHAREIEVVSDLAHHARLAVANARLHQRVAAMAITDPLTKLSNHGEFQRRIMEEMGRLHRYAALKGESHKLSVIMLDIDSFKAYNDQYGHPAGDDVLRTIAKVMEGAVRSFDVIARYGGEEFAVILPETPKESAMVVAERIRSAVAEHPFGPIDGRAIRVTVSLGVATSPDNGQTPADLIKRADRALYQSKVNGRNRITHAETTNNSPMADIVHIDAPRTRTKKTSAPTRTRRKATTKRTSTR